MFNRAEADGQVNLPGKVLQNVPVGVINPETTLLERIMIFFAGFNRQADSGQTADMIQKASSGAPDIRHDLIANGVRPYHVKVADLVNIVFGPEAFGVSCFS